MDPKPTSSSDQQVTWGTQSPVSTKPPKVKKDSTTDIKTSEVVKQTPLTNSSESSTLQNEVTQLEEHSHTQKVAQQVTESLESSSAHIPIAPKYLPKKEKYIDTAPKYKYLVEREQREPLEDIGALFVEHTQEDKINAIEQEIKRRTLEKEFQLKKIETKLEPLIAAQVNLGVLQKNKRILEGRLQNLALNPQKNADQINETLAQLQNLESKVNIQKKKVEELEVELGDKKNEIKDEFDPKQLKTQNEKIEDLKQRRNSLQSEYKQKISELRENIKNNPIDKRFYDQINLKREIYNTEVETLKNKQKELEIAIQNLNSDDPNSVARHQKAKEDYEGQLTLVKQAKFNADSAEWAVLSVLNREKFYEHKNEEIDHEQAVAGVHDRYVGQIVQQINNVQQDMPVEITLGELKEEKIKELDSLKIPGSEPLYFASLAQSNPPYAIIEMADFPAQPSWPDDYFQAQLSDSSTVQSQTIQDSDQKNTNAPSPTVTYSGKTAANPSFAGIAEKLKSSNQGSTLKEIDLSKTSQVLPEEYTEQETTDGTREYADRTRARISTSTTSNPIEEEQQTSSAAKTKTTSPKSREKDLSPLSKKSLKETETTKLKSNTVEPAQIFKAGDEEMQNPRKALALLKQKHEKKQIERQKLAAEITQLGAKINVIREQLKEPDFLPKLETRDTARLMMESYQENLAQLKLDLQDVDHEIKTIHAELESIENPAKGETLVTLATEIRAERETPAQLTDEQQAADEQPATENTKAVLDQVNEQNSVEKGMAKATLFAEAAKGGPFPAAQPMPERPVELHSKSEPVISAPGKTTGDQSGGEGSGSQQGQGRDQKRKEELKKVDEKKENKK